MFNLKHDFRTSDFSGFLVFLYSDFSVYHSIINLKFPKSPLISLTDKNRILLGFGEIRSIVWCLERTLGYRTDNVQAKCSKSRKWEKGSAECRNALVCWLVCKIKLSLWRYTTLPSYNFIEWMISMIVTVSLWRHSKYRTNQTGSIYFELYRYFL